MGIIVVMCTAVAGTASSNTSLLSVLRRLQVSSSYAAIMDMSYGSDASTFPTVKEEEDDNTSFGSSLSSYVIISTQS